MIWVLLTLLGCGNAQTCNNLDATDCDAHASCASLEATSCATDTTAFLHCVPNDALCNEMPVYCQPVGEPDACAFVPCQYDLPGWTGACPPGWEPCTDDDGTYLGACPT